MASSPITSWQTDGEKWKQRFYFLGLQNHCRPGNWKMPAPWKKSDDKCRLHIKNQRHHFAVKLPSSQSYGFSSILYGCESWTIKKAEHQRIDAVELWCWRRLLRVPWTARRSNQSFPKGNQPWIFVGRTDAEAETPIFWPNDVKNLLLEKTLMLGKMWKCLLFFSGNINIQDDA